MSVAEVAFGAIAQLVEQRTENPCVTGSIPVGTTQKKNPRKSLAYEDFFYMIVFQGILPSCEIQQHLYPLPLAQSV